MSKRDLENVDNDDPLRKRLKIREKCMFGDKCYRRNPHHFRQFSHPHIECLKKEALENEPTIVKEQYQMLKELNLLDCDVKGEQPTLPMPTSSRTTVTKDMHPILQRFKSQEPFNIFFTKVKDVPSTHRDSNSIFLTDLLHSCHGNLKSSVQINFLVDFDWLFMSYEATGNQNIPLLILHGEDNPSLKDVRDNVKALRIRSPYPFGTHHTKLMILVYDDDSVRVVVSTANLVPSDWENRTQAMWVSPKCENNPLNPSDSETGFKSSLIRYLTSYKVSQLHNVISTIANADFSNVNAFFLSSSPGSHEGSALCHYGHMAAASIIRKHSKPCTWPLVIQCSSIGSLGATPMAWLNELGDSLGPNHKDIKVIYPSKKNVLDSLDGIFGGGCLPYRRQVHQKQVWLRDYLHQWRSEKWARTKAMPHIKTYAQVQDDKAAFVLLTSANLSRAAWGKLNKTKDKLNIMSYEAGVLLLPKFLKDHKAKEEFFDLRKENKLVLPYDCPLHKYNDSDRPFFMDDLEEECGGA